MTAAPSSAAPSRPLTGRKESSRASGSERVAPACDLRIMILQMGRSGVRVSFRAFRAKEAHVRLPMGAVFAIIPVLGMALFALAGSGNAAASAPGCPEISKQKTAYEMSLLHPQISVPRGG